MTKYYAIPPHLIGKMTLYQFNYYLKEMDWLEGVFNPAPQVAHAPLKKPGEMMSEIELERLAKSINPELEIP